MLNPETIGRYREICNTHPRIEDYACFFAFGHEQFDYNLSAAIRSGRIKKSDKIVYHPHYSGLYGTEEGIRSFIAFYSNRGKAIPVECDPQEVYFYEFNNHESQIAWDGDLDAIQLVIDYFGVDAARGIKRFCAAYSIDDVISRKEAAC